MNDRKDATWTVLDLDRVPYTVPFSRLFVRNTADGLVVHRAAYERSLDDSIVIASLKVLDVSGQILPVEAASPFGIQLGPSVRLVVTRHDTLHLGTLPSGASLEVALGRPPLSDAGWPDQLGLPSDAVVYTREAVTCISLPTGGDVSIICGDRPVGSTTHAETVTQVSDEVSKWLERCPVVDDAWAPLVRLCWWVLGVNTLELGGAASGRAVVPSKLGYVGLWQWDAYFIAIGLRHGDPVLAAEQLRIAMSHPQASGLLPDVMHEAGVLASSDDLPAGDLETLRAMSSPSLRDSSIPLTKPPLTALAVALVAEHSEENLVHEFVDVILASQEWWYRESDPHGAGAPAYLHPYSSGLDDSPVFDHEAIVSSPDLLSYLIVQDRLLSRWLHELNRPDEAQHCSERANRTTAILTSRWDRGASMFRSIGESGKPLTTDAVIGLLPLLVEKLPPEIAKSLLAATNDADRYGTVYRLPTVSTSDPSYNPDRMWRGPVWVNINWLVARGLREQGFCEEADALERETLTMAVRGGGPHEYFHPVDAAKAPGATTCFGWSAALLVDMAVRLSGHS